MEKQHEHDLNAEQVDEMTAGAASDTATSEPSAAESHTGRTDSAGESEAVSAPAAAEPAANRQPGEAEIAAMVAEAEQRGYLRGRNEAIENALGGPGLWQLATDDGEPVEHPEVPILQALRPSVWDL